MAKGLARCTVTPVCHDGCNSAFRYSNLVSRLLIHIYLSYMIFANPIEIHKDAAPMPSWTNNKKPHACSQTPISTDATKTQKPSSSDRCYNAGYHHQIRMIRRVCHGKRPTLVERQDRSATPTQCVRVWRQQQVIKPTARPRPVLPPGRLSSPTTGECPRRANLRPSPPRKASERCLDLLSHTAPTSTSERASAASERT